MKNLLSLTIPGPNGSVQIETPAGIPSGTRYTVGSLSTTALQTAMVFGVLISLLYLVYGGWFWLQSKGDKEKLDKARRIILNSIIGLIVMALSLVVVNLIASALGVRTAINP